MSRVTRSGTQYASPAPPSCASPSESTSDSETDQRNLRKNAGRKQTKTNKIKRPRSAISKSGSRSNSKCTRTEPVIDEPDPINAQTGTLTDDGDNDTINDIDNDHHSANDDIFTLPPPLIRPNHNQLAHVNISDAQPRPTHSNSSNLFKFDSDLVLPTLDNHKQAVADWPQARMTAFERTRRLGNVVPPKIYDELVVIQKLYRQHKSLLAMIGNISLYTLNKSIGELGGTQGQDAYHIWLSYGKKDKVKHEMPVNRQKGVLSRRNKDLGALWKPLSDVQNRVVDPQIFYTLSGLPKPKSDDDEDSDPDEVLEPEELAELQEVYDDMIDKDKVAKVYAKVAAGILDGTSLAGFNRKSLKCVDRLHKQIQNESNRMELGYYLIASFTHVASEGHASEPGWCQEYTSHQDMAEYLHSKANFQTIFATHTQGLSVNEAVAKQIGHQSTSKPAKQPPPGDLLKGNLARTLRSEIDNLLKVESRGFPRGPDPVNLLPSKYPRLEIIQLPGSTLTSEKLMIGFDKMTSSTHQLWLNDFLNGKFKIKLKSVPGDSDDIQALKENIIDDENRACGLDQGNNGLDEVNTGELSNLENEPNDKDGDDEEEEEWAGIDISSFVPF